MTDKTTGLPVLPVEVTQADDAVAKLIDPDAWHETLPTDGCGAYWMGRRNKARAQAHAIHALISDRASNKAGGLWYRRWFTAQTRVNELEALIDNPPAHRFWGAGEPDCPSDIKAGNGELHTLRCKACGQDNPRNDRCHRLTPRQDGAGELADMANVGEALMEAIRDYSSHPFMQSWSPADCPTEIVGDLLNALDEAGSPTSRQDGLREAATKLLEACEYEANANGGDFGPLIGPPAYALQAALSDISPLANEAPVAWMYTGPEGERYTHEHRDLAPDWLARNGWTETPLYARPLANDTGALREALVDHNERLRSAVAIADRDGADTNWLAFRGQCRFTLAEHHDVVNEARAAVARKAGYAPGNYSIVCIDCRKECHDCDKRAIRCADCAAALSPDDGEGK